MTERSFDRDAWQRRWEQALAEHGERLALRPANGWLQAVATGLAPGRALDAGCGHGAEALWLAGAGWAVTAVDFSAAALDHGRATARSLGPDVVQRLTWLEADLTTWTPPAAAYDLVACLYLHVPGSVSELVRRLGSGVAPGGSLLLVGHQPTDPETGTATAAADQVQVSVATARAALPADSWELVVAELQARPVQGTGVDAVVHAVRRPRGRPTG